MPLGERPDLADHLLDPLFGLDFSLWLLEAGGFPDVPLALGQETYDLVVHHVYALPHLIEALGGSSRSSATKISSVCSPTPGIGAITGSTPAGVAGGSSAHSGPAGDSTYRQQSRAFSCGWSRNCWTVLSRALAMLASSRRSIASFSESRAKTLSIFS